jgi:hypothetical protein
MAMRLSAIGDSFWKKDSAANHIHDFRESMKKCLEFPADDESVYSCTQKVSGKAKSIIYTITHEKHPLDLHGKPISYVDIGKELQVLAHDLRAIAVHISENIPAYYSTTNCELPDVDSVFYGFGINYPEYRSLNEHYRDKARKKCQKINGEADQMEALLPMLKERIKRGDDYVEERTMDFRKRRAAELHLIFQDQMVVDVIRIIDSYLLSECELAAGKSIQAKPIQLKTGFLNKCFNRIKGIKLCP